MNAMPEGRVEVVDNKYKKGPRCNEEEDGNVIKFAGGTGWGS